MRTNGYLLGFFNRLLGRGAVFFLLLSLLLLGTYLLGNFQEFLDGSQRLLLRGLGVALALEVVFGVLYLGSLMLQAAASGRLRLLRFLLAALALALCVVLLLALKFLGAWIQL